MKNKFIVNNFEGIYNEMATVGRSQHNNFSVIVNPDSGRSDRYFKYCNHLSYDRCTKVIRISFLEPEWFYHRGDGKKLWMLNSKEIKQLIEFMNSTPKGDIWNFKTNWEKSIYQWDEECHFVGSDDWDLTFPSGCNPNSELAKNPQFVPLDTKMPDCRLLRMK